MRSKEPNMGPGGAGGAPDAEAAPSPAADTADKSRSTSASPSLSKAEEFAAALPRILIAEGLAEGLSEDWVRRVEVAQSAGQPGMPRFALGDPARQTLFELRRARRVVRGLEEIESALAAEAAGLSKAPATQTDSGKPRISRLLILSADGAPRFYRGVEQLTSRFAARATALVLECDEDELGEAVFGPGRRSRAIMLDHKNAVVEFLLALAEQN